MQGGVVLSRRYFCEGTGDTCAKENKKEQNPLVCRYLFHLFLSTVDVIRVADNMQKNSRPDIANAVREPTHHAHTPTEAHTGKLCAIASDMYK